MKQVRNIIVTGSNKGIGLGIVNHLANSQNWNIIMACRNVQFANKARDQVLAKYPNSKVTVEQLDISDSKSIDAFVPLIKEKYQHIDVLVNNAGVAAKGDAFDVEVFNFTFQTNFFGTIEFTEKMIPLLSDNGKIVTLGSMAGKMAFKRITNQQIQKRFRNQNVSKEQLVKLVEQFKDAIASNQVEQRGWAKWTYGISKLAINTYFTYLGRQKEVMSRGIQVYSCCPGYVATDMTSHKGTLTIDQGIRTPVHLIELPFQINKDLQGGFFQKQKLSSKFEDIQ